MPDLVFDSRRVHRVVILREQWIAREIKVWQVAIALGLVKRVRIFVALTALITVHDLFQILLAARMVLVCSPVGVEFVTDLPVLFLLVGLLDERMLQELRPGESLTGRLVEQALQERFELGRHIVWELDWILDDQVDQRVDAVRVEGRGAHEKLVDDDTE